MSGTDDDGARLDTEPLLAGLRTCGAPDDPIAAFWGSDEGEGWPGRGPDSPSGSDIWTITADGRVTAMTHDATSRDPWISPDGQRIYFARSAVGSLGGGVAPGEQIWVHDVPSGTETMIATTLTDAESQEMTDAEESPDGSMVVYTASLSDAGHAFSRLYTIDLGSADQPTPLPLPLPADGGLAQGQREPTFSTDGSSVAYLHTDDTDPAGELQMSIRVIDLRTMEDSALYTPSHARTLHGLEWSPDGSSLLVTDEFATAVTIDVDTGHRSVVATNTTAGVTYSGADGETVSGVGRTWAIPEPSRHLTNLTSWHDNTITTTEFPVRLSFVVGLTIADCAYS